MDKILFVIWQNIWFRSFFEMYVDLSIIFYVLSKILTLLDILKNEMPVITFMWLVRSGLWPMAWSINICNKFPRDADAAVRGLPFK